jgi:predicted Zn-dependent protease
LHNRKKMPPKPADYFEKVGFMKSTKKDRLNGLAMLNEFSSEVWRKDDPHYDFFITNFGLYLPKIKKTDCIGMTRKGFAAIVSVKELNKLTDQDDKAWVLKTIVLRQLGHLFGLPTISNAVDKKRRYCPNKCVMRQAYKMLDYIVLTEDRMRTGEPFCKKCSADLYRFFHPNIR